MNGRKKITAKVEANFWRKPFSSTDYLPLTITSALTGMIDSSENRISRLLFKLTVELSMLMNLYAAQNDVDEEVLRKLRGKCLTDVKKTNGRIRLEDIIDYQKGIKL